MLYMNNNSNNSEEQNLSWKGLDKETKIAIIIIVPLLLFILGYNIYTRSATK